jgi:Fe-S cluster assembly protein SufD
VTAAVALEQAFASRTAGRDSDEERRARAFDRFRQSGLPTRNAEDWRWANLGLIEPALQARPANDRLPDVDQWFLKDMDGARLVFVDGHYVAALSDCGEVRVGPAAGGSGHPLGDLAEAFAQGGYRLEIGAEHAARGTVQLVHVATGGASHLAHAISLGEDAQASIVETYVALPGVASWTNVAVTVELARSARLMRRTRRFAGGQLTTELVRARLGQGASYASFALAAGGTARLENHVELAGLGAFAAVDGILLGAEEETLDVLNRLRHLEQATTSRQTWRSVGHDLSTCSVAAGVEVAQGAVKADAEQSLRALLMKRTATANAKPELAIYADDVRCAHGATVGELDPMTLFYLQSRGIPRPEARAMLTEAFLADALSEVREEQLHGVLLDGVKAWLEKRR